MNIMKCQKGGLSLGNIIFLLILGAAIYVGAMMAVPWINFYQVEELFKNQVVRLKVASEEEVRAAIDLKLKELEVTLPDDGLEVVREEGKQPTIEATYKVDVNFIGGYKYTYVFKPRGEAPKGAGYN